MNQHHVCMGLLFSQKKKQPFSEQYLTDSNIMDQIKDEEY